MTCTVKSSVYDIRVDGLFRERRDHSPDVPPSFLVTSVIPKGINAQRIPVGHRTESTAGRELLRRAVWRPSEEERNHIQNKQTCFYLTMSNSSPESSLQNVHSSTLRTRMNTFAPSSPAIFGRGRIERSVSIFVSGPSRSSKV